MQSTYVPAGWPNNREIQQYGRLQQVNEETCAVCLLAQIAESHEAFSDKLVMTTQVFVDVLLKVNMVIKNIQGLRTPGGGSPMASSIDNESLTNVPCLNLHIPSVLSGLSFSSLQRVNSYFPNTFGKASDNVATSSGFHNYYNYRLLLFFIIFIIIF